MERKSLKVIRVSKNLSQEKVAKDTGICMRTLSLWEQGKRSPRVDKFKVLLDYYNVSFEEVDI